MDTLYVNGDGMTFESFGPENIPRENQQFIRNKIITKNIYRIQAYNWKICGYFCIEFIDFMLKGKGLLGYSSLFSPNEYERMKNQY